MLTGVVFGEEWLIETQAWWKVMSKQHIRIVSQWRRETEREIPLGGLGVLPVGMSRVCTGCLSRDILLYPHLWDTIWVLQIISASLFSELFFFHFCVHVDIIVFHMVCVFHKALQCSVGVQNTLRPHLKIELKLDLNLEIKYYDINMYYAALFLGH